MRFALSLILSSFFFIAPFQGNAGKVPGNQLTTDSKKSTSTTTYRDHSISGDHLFTIINSNHRNSSSTQSRPYTFGNFISPVDFQKQSEFFYEEELFVHPYSYCKRIGLKLVFPEHYFW
jgi:hypothetical protein